MKNDLNLLPKDIASAKVDDRRLINGTLIIAIFAVLGFLVGLPTIKKYSLTAQKEKLVAEKNGIMDEASKKDLQKYKIEMQEIERDTKLETIVNKTEMEYKEVLNAIEVSIPKRVKINSISMHSNDDKVTVRVTGTDEVAVADFWNNLRKTKVFDEVHPEGITKLIPENNAQTEPVYTCSIELTYVQKG